MTLVINKMNKNMKKITKLIILCGTLISLSGCVLFNEPAMVAKSQQTITNKYPQSSIVSLPDNSFKFIVRDTNNAVHYVETMNNFNSEITEDIILLPAK